jgi:hypothetical protein
MKVTEQDKNYFRKLIWENVYELFLTYNINTNHKSLLKQHKKFINSFPISWNNKKHKSLIYLETFLKTKNKDLAKQQFINSIYYKIK